MFTCWSPICVWTGVYTGGGVSSACEYICEVECGELDACVYTGVGIRCASAIGVLFSAGVYCTYGDALGVLISVLYDP